MVFCWYFGLENHKQNYYRKKLLDKIKNDSQNSCTFDSTEYSCKNNAFYQKSVLNRLRKSPYHF